MSISAGKRNVSGKRRMAAIVFIFFFILLLLIWEAYELIRIHGMSEIKAVTILNLTIFFLAFSILGIFFILMKFGYSIADIKHVPRFIATAASIEEKEIANRQKEYDLGYYLLSIISGSVFFYCLAVLSVIAYGEEGVKVFLGGIIRGVVYGILIANFLIPAIYFAGKGSLSDKKDICFGIHPKGWIIAGSTVLMLNLTEMSEFYFITAISAISMGIVSYIYIKIQSSLLILLFLLALTSPYLYILRQL